MGGKSSDNALVGRKIGKYEVLKRLTAGGMAELFLARKTGIQGFQKVFALKRILPHLADDEDFVAMFLQEAKLAASLEHPNIVHVSDFGKADSDYYFVMAYVHGRDLLSVLRGAARNGTRIPIPCAITITLGICAGLHYAHEHKGLDGQPLGIVHRDVSPTNILISYDGNVKIVDFGIAKAAAHNANTVAGVRKGKASYMSPEQCRGGGVDRRSDIWSIGVVLWEMLTMARLYKADDELAIMHKVMHKEPTPIQVMDPDAPEQLQSVLDRCLTRDPAKRYQTARELQQDLLRVAAEIDLHPSSTGLAEYMKLLFGEPELPWVGLGLEDAPSASDSDSKTIASLQPGAPSRAPVETTPARPLAYSSNVQAMPPHASMWATPPPGSAAPPTSKALWIGGGALLGANAAVLVWWLSTLLAASQAPVPGAVPGVAPAPAPVPVVAPAPAPVASPAPATAPPAAPSR